MMGPAYGTQEYKDQVEQISTVLSNSAVSMKEAEQIAMLYIMDESYSRSAISEALGIVERTLRNDSP